MIALLDQLRALWQRVAETRELRWLLLLAVVLVVARWLRRRVRQAGRKSREPSPLEVDVETLPVPPTPGGQPLRVYHVPMRIGLVVVAPLGRDADRPQGDDLPDLLDHAVPGLGRLIRTNPPACRIWPAQMSADGFRHAFFRHVKLPQPTADRSPWCLLAGRITAGQHRYVLGLALCADEPNNLGRIAVESEHHWLDVLRLSE